MWSLGWSRWRERLGSEHTCTSVFRDGPSLPPDLGSPTACDESWFHHPSPRSDQETMQEGDSMLTSHRCQQQGRFIVCMTSNFLRNPRDLKERDSVVRMPGFAGRRRCDGTL